MLLSNIHMTNSIQTISIPAVVSAISITDNVCWTHSIAELRLVMSVIDLGKLN